MPRYAIRRFMTVGPHVITSRHTLAEAHQTMRERGVRHLPVVDDGHLKGVVSQRDLYLLVSQVARRVGKGDAALATGGPIDGQPGVRTVEVANGALPVFRYFDGTGAQIAYANLPNDIPRIRRIEIALLVRSADVDPNTGQQRQMAYSTSVIPRNHGITGF